MSWEGDPDARARRSTDDADSNGTATSSTEGSTPIRPDSILPTPTSVAPWLVSSDEPGRGVDPLPSTGSLVWAPDRTEPVTIVAERPDPAVGPVWPDPTGEPLTSGPRVGSPSTSGAERPDTAGAGGGFTPPPSPAYTGGSRPAAHLPRRRMRGGPRPLVHVDRWVLAAVGVVLVLAVVAGVLTRGDGPDPSATPASGAVAPADADAGDPAGPIVGPTGVIGSWSGSDWVPRADGDQPGAGLEFTVLGLDDSFATAPGRAVDEDCPAPGAATGVDVAVDLPGGDGPQAIAVAGVADPRPRPIERFRTDGPVYGQAAAEVAAGLGVSTPPTVTQVLRADLDGSGTFEVLVAAEHITDPQGLSPTPGDWSVVFLRRVVGDGVATDVLASSVAGGGAADGAGLERIQVATLADLNRDGAMEIALAGRSAGGAWTAIHAVGDDGVPAEVLRAGCPG